MVNAGGAFTVMATAWPADIFTASVIWNVTELLPAGPVGVPVMAPVLLFRVNPAGSDPEVMENVYGLVPPDSLSVPLYAVPAVAAREVVVMAGSGATLICNVAIFVVSVTEVAVTVAVNAVVTLAGALYVAELVVALASVPPPDTAQVTPAVFGSCLTVAVMGTVWA
jgi:hypothetical protein